MVRRKEVPSSQFGFYFSEPDLTVRQQLFQVYPDLSRPYAHLEQSGLWQKPEARKPQQFTILTFDSSVVSVMAVVDRDSLNILEHYTSSSTMPIYETMNRKGVVTFGPRNVSDIGIYDKDELKQSAERINISACILRTRTDAVQTDEFVRVLTGVRQLLLPESPVFIIEDDLTGIRRVKNWRKAIVTSAGFAAAAIDTSQHGYIVWSGRLPLEHKEIDLFVKWKAGSGKEHIIPNIKTTGAVYLLNNNLQVINWDIMDDHLHHVSNTPWTLEQLRRGHGTRVRATCGCEGTISISGKGKKNSLKACHAPGCQMDDEFYLNEHPERQVDLNFAHQIARLLMRAGETFELYPCFDCGGKVMRTVTEIGEKNGFVKFQITERCSCWDESIVSYQSVNLRNLW